MKNTIFALLITLISFPAFAHGDHGSPARVLEEYQQSINRSCETDYDCVVKNVGNCCGYYPSCVNSDAIVNPDLVSNYCAENGMSGICGFPDIQSCQCQNKTCIAAER